MNSSGYSTLIIAMSCMVTSASSQYILNGDFEFNNAPQEENQWNLTNAQFNAMVPDCFSFGQPGWANLDLITNGVGQYAESGGSAHSGDWFIGMQGTDRLALRLSEPLTLGQNYQLSYHDRAVPRRCATGFSFGLSTTPNSMGTYIHNSSYSHWPVEGVWKLRVFSFTAPLAAEFITVRIFDEVGCWQHVDDFCLSASSDCATPEEINVPNVFTPNSDGVNDRFMPFAGTTILEGSMEIYNRWGQLVFSTEDIDNGWDGTSNERRCSDGVYFYRLSYTTVFGETENRHGSVTLLSGR